MGIRNIPNHFKLQKLGLSAGLMGYLFIIKIDFTLSNLFCHFLRLRANLMSHRWQQKSIFLGSIFFSFFFGGGGISHPC